MDTFSTMRAFRRIVELGGLARAAEDLGLSSAGLSKQLRALEAHLDTVLLQRTTRSMSLTETGRAYYADCCRILDELDVLENATRQQSQRVTGRLRLNAPLSFTLSILSPLLAEFMREYPDVQLDLVMEDRLVDAVAHGFDLTIRLRSSLDNSTLIARRLATVKQVLCAAPSYLEQNGEPATPSNLRHHRILTYSLAQKQSILPAQEHAVSGGERTQISNSLLLRDLLVAGLGIGALPSFLADPAMARGELRRVLPAFMDEPRHVYAVYPTGRHLQPKVKTFVEFLARRLPSVMNDYS